jgi:hypothetical protein
MRSIFVAFLVISLSLLLVIPAMAQTEDELVAQFLKKTEKKKTKKVGFFIINGSFGRLNRDNDYNKFSVRVTPLITSVDGTTIGVDKIDYSQEFFGGFGFIVSPKSSASIGFAYWLKMGSSQSGDMNLSLVNLNASDPAYDFDLKSEVQVYGIAGNVDYFLTNPPDADGQLTNLSFKIGAGLGYYFANWEVWDGFTGYNLATGEPEVINGELEGQALGVSLQLAAEYPINLGGLVLESSAKYLYLNFTDMKWYNSYNEETVATVNNSGLPVELNLSGPRFQIGLKRYFSW